MKITGMTMAILVAANFLLFVMAMIGLNQQLTAGITTLGLGPYQTLTRGLRGGPSDQNLMEQEWVDGR